MTDKDGGAPVAGAAVTVVGTQLGNIADVLSRNAAVDAEQNLLARILDQAAYLLDAARRLDPERLAAPARIDRQQQYQFDLMQ